MDRRRPQFLVGGSLWKTGTVYTFGRCLFIGSFCMLYHGNALGSVHMHWAGVLGHDMTLYDTLVFMCQYCHCQEWNKCDRYPYKNSNT